MNLMQTIFLVLILGWLAWHLAVPVDFIRSDLGTHLKNGELILQGKEDVLYKNYYSYIVPDAPYVNHDWLFGVLSFVIWHYVGFTGLGLVNLGLMLAAFYLFLRVAQRQAPWGLAAAFALLSMPLVSMRSEIRPETMSYLFSGIFWYMLDSYERRQRGPKDLFIRLGILQVIWANTHAFFIIGPVLIMMFWMQARCNGQTEQSAVLGKLFIFLLALCLVNPSGIYNLTSVFHLSKAYAYQVLETQPASYLWQAGFGPWKAMGYYFLLLTAALWAVLFDLVRAQGWQRHIKTVLSAGLISLAAWKAVRMMGLFGFFVIPLSAYACGEWLKSKPEAFRKTAVIFLLASGAAASGLINFDWHNQSRIGTMPGSDQAAEFFKREKIAGPIFNNFDDGGYLIFHFGPAYRVFVDPRIEAYPEAFFTRLYIPMQNNSVVWAKLDQQYHFNAIFFSTDATPWASVFLKERCADPNWAVVYDTDKAMILLRRDAQNQDIIKRNEIKVVYVQA